MTQTMAPPAQSPQDRPVQPVYEISEQDKKRQEKIAQAWKAYQGELEPPLKIMPDGTDPNVMTNPCVVFVNGGINFLFGQEFEISCAEDTPQEAQDCINDAWGRKEARLPLCQGWAMNGANAGQGFIRIVPDIDGTFDLVVIDPSTVFVQTAPQDCKRVLLFCIQYSCMEKINGQPKVVYYREEIAGDYPETINGVQASKPTSWTIQHWTQVAVSAGMQPKIGDWTPAGEPILWPYKFPPLFGNQNLINPNDYWGIPDITPDIIGVNKSLNLTKSCIQLMILLYGQPILYATGTGEQVINIMPGRIIGLPTTESKVVAVTLTCDIANALAYAHDLRSDIDEQSGVPGVATGRIETMPRGNLSGIAIELLFQPDLKKTDTKRCLYGEVIIDVSKALLVLNGFSDDIDITLAWQNPLPHDDLPDAQKSVILKQIGISNTTLQREAGYDPEEELALSKAEDARELEKQQQLVAIQQPVAQPGQQQGGQQP